MLISFIAESEIVWAGVWVAGAAGPAGACAGAGLLD
jgi:hypothetical protein